MIGSVQWILLVYLGPYFELRAHSDVIDEYYLTG